MNPRDYPEQRHATGRRARLGDFALSPNTRARPEDYPVNDADSPIKVVDVQRRRRQHDPLRRRTSRASIPRDFRVRTLDGVADDWPIDYAHARAVLRRERPHDGRRRPGRRSRLSAEGACRCRRCRSASSARRSRAASTSSAGTGGRRTARSRRASTRAARRCINLGHCIAGLRAGRQGQHRHHLLAARDPRAACELRTRCRVREITVDANGMADGVDLLRRRRRRAAPARRGRRRSPATASARRGCCSTRARSASRTGSPIAAAWSART